MEATLGPRPASAGLEPGPASAIGRFEIVRKLGEGGMGAVYLATDPSLGRRVAIKVLHRDGGGDTEAARRRLLREAQGTAQLSHEHVVVVHEVGTHDEQVYLAMEYVAGTTLKGWQAGRGWREILAMYRRAGQGLQAAHDAGLVHRDFKPDNVLVGDDGRVRVTDFGLVAAIDEAALNLSHETAVLRSDLDLAVSMTRTGTVMGTPRYMAPEQHLGEPVDARADQFAFCVALYEAWYRQPPFAGQRYDVMVSHVLASELVRPPSTSDVPTALRDAVLRGLSRQREDRYPSMRDLLAALAIPEASAARPPASPRPRWPWLAGGLAVVAIGAVLVGHGRHRPSQAEGATTADQADVDKAFASPSERSNGSAKARRAFARAQEALRTERYDEAIDGFKEAHDAMPSVDMPYNIGAAYHLKARAGSDVAAYRLAQRYYEAYLSAAPDGADLTAIEHRLAGIDAEIGGPGARITCNADDPGPLPAGQDPPVAI